MKLADKHLAFIVSGGRTGTTFFADVLADLIEDSFSVHEPDLFDGISVRSFRAIKSFGVYHMTMGRLLGRTGIRNLSQKYLAGELCLSEVVAAIHRHRDDYYASIRQNFIIESYYQWYGVLPAISAAFPGAKILGIVRDPRSWVTSWMNYGGHFDATDRVTRLGFRRLDPRMVGDVETAKLWPRMSPFEKNCWHWKTITTLLIDQNVRDDAHTKICRFEDLFLSEERGQHFQETLGFLAEFPDRSYQYTWDPTVLEEVRNASERGSFPCWREWTVEMATQLDFFCGDLMRFFGYGNELQWRAKLKS